MAHLELSTRYYVCRVLLHQGRRVQMSMLEPGQAAAVEASINAGDLCMLSDGAICEPVEESSNEADAHKRRDQLMEGFRGEDFRVVMVAPIPDNTGGKA